MKKLLLSILTILMISSGIAFARPSDPPNIVKILKLSPQKIKIINKLRENHQEKQEKLSEQLHNLINRLETELDKKNINKSKTNKLVSEISNIRKKMLENRITQTIKIHDILSDKELATLKEYRQHFHHKKDKRHHQNKEHKRHSTRRIWDY